MDISQKQQVMATTLQPLRWSARSCTCRESIYKYVSSSASTRRALSTTRRRWDKSVSPNAAKQNERAAAEASLQKLTETNESIAKLYNSVSVPEQITSKDLTEGEFLSLGHAAPIMEKQKKKKPKDTFLNLGDPDPWEEDGQLEDDHDDITSLGHGELEKHREMRHYARLAAWEMPLLASMCKLSILARHLLIFCHRYGKGVRATDCGYAITIPIHILLGRTASSREESRLGVFTSRYAQLDRRAA